METLGRVLTRPLSFLQGLGFSVTPCTKLRGKEVDQRVGSLIGTGKQKLGLKNYHDHHSLHEEPSYEENAQEINLLLCMQKLRCL